MKQSNRAKMLVTICLLLLSGTAFTLQAKAQSPYIWGNDQYGQLGDGTAINTNRLIPAPLTALTNVTQMSADAYHAFAVKSDGTLWAWGWNLFGQLGDGTGGDKSNNYDKSSPVQITSLSGIVQVKATWQHTIALKSDGTVWAWGENTYGELGDGTGDGSSGKHDKNYPVQALGLTGVVQVSASGFSSFALKSDGTVWVWGGNGNGNLGLGKDVNFKNVPVPLAGLNGVIQIAGGTEHALALKSDGTVWAWGHNNYGQVGDGTGGDHNDDYDRYRPIQITSLSNVVYIAAAGKNSFAVKSDGTVWAWGWNYYGQVGDGTGADNTSDHNQNAPVQAVGLTGVVLVEASALTVFAVKSDGTVWAWGHNTYGQLGGGVTPAKNIPTLTDIQGITQVAPGATFTMTLTTARTTTTAVPAQTSAYGSTVLTARVTLGKTGFPLALRKATFFVDGVAVGQATTNANGIASLSALVSAGKHTLKVTALEKGRLFAGSGKGTLVVTKLDTKLKAQGGSVRLGEMTNLTATLKRNSDGMSLANQTISFTLNGAAIGSAKTDSNGKAALPYKADSADLVGKQKVVASFDGDTNYMKVADTTSLTINKGKTALVQESVSGKASSTLNLSAKLTRLGDDNVIAGRTVTFSVGGVKVGTGVTDSQGVATLSYTLPSKTGTYALKVIFGGDTAYTSSSYDKATLTVK